MIRALQGLEIAPDCALVDGLPWKEFPVPHEGVVKGDSKSLSIAAASILAKVSRDRYMDRMAAQYPQFGFDRHRGYGTLEHRNALEKFGPCQIHRRSFAPVAQLTFRFTD